MAHKPSPVPNMPAPPEDDQGMTLIDHLIELRKRLAYAVLAVLIGMVVGFVLVVPGGPVELVNIIILAFAPINQDYAPLLSTGTAETFTSYMTVALATGVVLGMPMIVYQLIAFISPGLTSKERRLILVAVPVVMIFFAIGLSFGWLISVPAAIRFLIGFSDSALIQVQPTISDFLRIVTVLLLVNGVVFELPIIIYMLAYMGITTAQQLRKYRRYAVVIVAIIAAFITPTGDPINWALLSIPMYLLFELGVILAHFVPNR
jgi:sec-independent protein translocase protein TatC